jgi:phage-related tail protein
LIETVLEHPVPAALVGAGVAWMVYEGVRRRYPEAVYERTKDALETVGEGFSSIGEKVSEAAASTGESFRDQFEESAAASRERTARFGQSVKAGAARVGEMVRDGASAAGYAIEQGYDSGRGALGDLWQNHPLACGVGVMALGVAAGLMLPATQAERRAAGERSRRLLERAGNAGRGLLNQGKEIAGRVLNKGASTVADEAEREGITPERLARKVRRIARRVGEAVSDAAEGE